MYTIEQIVDHTGLKLKFVRKCVNRFKPFLEPYMQRGDNNRILFNSSGLMVFDQIKQLKEQALTLPKIEQNLKSTLETNLDN